MHKKILIISDIEGSSGCWNYRASSFLTQEWAKACIALSEDLDCICRSLFNAGVQTIRIKDFHRTGYNIIPGLIDSRVEISQGYSIGPVPGLGDPKDATAILMVGLHSSSGKRGFLPHTLTSRISGFTVNGKRISEAEIFSASLASFGLSPVFFSGCPVACAEAESNFPGIVTHCIDKTSGKENLDPAEWRKELAASAVKAVNNMDQKPFEMTGPFKSEIRFRDDGAAEKISKKWKLDFRGNSTFFSANDFDTLYQQLIRICYFSPVTEKALPFFLKIYNSIGRAGLRYVRRQIKKNIRNSD